MWSIRFQIICSLNLRFNKADPTLNINLYFFFAHQDLIFSLGYDNILPYYSGKKKNISQRASIKGTLRFDSDRYIDKSEYPTVNVILKDVRGFSSYGGLPF